jgi:DNA-binding NarL/FixJ family response regulator
VGLRLKVNCLRILLADEHALVRAGIRALLSLHPDFEVVAEAGDGREALRLIGEEAPDVAIVDASIPRLNGLETAERAAREHPRTRVLLLSVLTDEDHVRRALLAGAAGVLWKGAEPGELELAVRAVARGETWLSPAISRAAVADLPRDGESRRAHAHGLTPRQREILQLIAEGLSTKEMALHLQISVKTVETHRAQVMGRLGIRSVPGLVRYALRAGIIPLES